MQNLKRKYGAAIADILAYREKIENEYRILSDGDNQIETLEKAYREAVDTFGTLAKELSDRRKAAAKKLMRETIAELNGMGMPHAAMETAFTEIPKEQLAETGIDEAMFLLSANRGEPVKPLIKVASGGEMSRIMLAMKAALSDADRIETLIFDEIDTGISGMVANAVAEKSTVDLRNYWDSQGYKYEYVETEGGHIWRNWRIYLTMFAQKIFK